MNRRKAMWAGVIVLIAVAGTMAYFRFRGGEAEGAVRVSGNIEVTDVDVSFRIPGRVQERLVGEGMMVTRGQLVARLDIEDLEGEVRLKEAERRAAEAALRDLLAGSRPQEIGAARATVARADAEAVRLVRDDERAAALYSRGVIAAREYEAAKAASEVARARVKEAREALLLVEEGPRKETIELARARLEQAGEALKLAKVRLGYGSVTAPLSGVVLSENVEAGDYVAPGTPVVTVGDLSNVWLRAYIEETDLGRVKIGQPVTVTTDTYPGKKYTGRVSFIAPQAEFTPKSVQTQKERVKLVYRIKVDIPNPAMELKPGMPADAVIRTEEAGEGRVGRDSD
jgi:HlyD family secretion protein